MYNVDVYLRVRRAVMVEGKSIREVSREFGLHRDTVRKMLAYSVPPGYRRQTPPRRPKLEPFTGVIDRILEDDLRRPRKQRHTAKRIFERLRDEVRVRRRIHHGQGLRKGASPPDQGDVRAAVPLAGPRPVRLWRGPGGHRRCGAEGPLLRHRPAPQRRLLRQSLSVRDHRGLPGRPRVSPRLPGRGPPGHPLRQYQAGGGEDTGRRRRQRTRAFTELQSHYLFEDRFGRPGKGNDKGKVEGLVGYMRRNFLVPVPSFESFDALNAYLEQRCLERMDAQLRGHTETIGQRMERDLDALLPLPPVAYDACDKQASRVSSLSLVRYRTNDYSVPVAYGYRDVLVRGYVDEVVISCGTEVIASHPRSYERDDFVYDPIHYLPLLERKPGALDAGRSAAGLGSAR